MEEAVEAFMASDKPVLRLNIPQDKDVNYVRNGMTAVIKDTPYAKKLKVSARGGYVQVIKKGAETIPAIAEADGKIDTLDSAYLEGRGFEWQDSAPTKKERHDIRGMIAAFLESPHKIVKSTEDTPKSIYVSLSQYIRNHPEDNLGVKSVNGAVYFFKKESE